MKKKILLIEDDLLACRACEERLREMGYEIDLALDGEEGVAKIGSGCDGIILDIALPKLDGWEILSQLAGDQRRKQIPVIVWTVLDGDHHREKARKLGAVAFVNKFKEDLFEEITKFFPPPLLTNF